MQADPGQDEHVAKRIRSEVRVVVSIHVAADDGERFAGPRARKKIMKAFKEPDFDKLFEEVIPEKLQ